MTFHFADALASAVLKKGAPLAIGLDPHLNQLPDFLQVRFKHLSGSKYFQEAANAVLEFNRLVLDAVEQDVVAVKPQFAFYEQLGSHGWRALEETCAYAREKGLLIVADAKRGDISSTGAAYARAILDNNGPIGADSVTLNPWMGLDTLDPFLKLVEEQGKGIFVLLRTTNPKSSFFQHHGQPSASVELARQLALMASDNIGTSGMSNIGAVVGASAHTEAQQFREIHPTGWFLVPGVGAQGASAKEGLASANDSGMGALVVASRSLLFPPTPFKHAEYDSAPTSVKQSVLSATQALKSQLIQTWSAE
jgi:orotidine-5'-phosphate decarboxylase